LIGKAKDTRILEYSYVKSQ